MTSQMRGRKPVTTTVVPSPMVRRRPALSIYLRIALVCLLIALAGFWPTYFGPLLTGIPHPLPIIHLHATVFTGWLVILITQATLAARGRMALHMKVGKFGIGWGVFLIFVGWATAFSRFGDRVLAGDLSGASDRLFAPFTDMIVFAPFLFAAWHYRHKPEIHKRLIVVATTILLIAAVHRMTFLGGRPPPVPQLLLVWLSPIALGMTYDYVKRRIVHPVYLLGIAAVFLLKFGRLPLRNTEAWRDFTHWLATFYA